MQEARQFALFSRHNDTKEQRYSMKSDTTTFVTHNPHLGEDIAEHTTLSDAQIDEALQRSHVAYSQWSARSLEERVVILHNVARELRARANGICAIESKEMGKPIAQARGELELAAAAFDYYADQGPTLLADEPIEVTGGGRGVIRTAPLGVILGIMPWNFPLYQSARFVAPSLLVGNTVLLKHARATTGTGEAFAEALRAAGVPDGVFENLVCSPSQLLPLIADDRLQGVSLTGSEAAGRTIGEAAGRNLKKAVLELGGSDPFIVLGDADLDDALEFAEVGRFNNAGQSCNSSKRMIIHDSVWDQFLDGLVERSAAWVGADPLDEATKLGPMASVSARDELVELIDDAVRLGATIHVGGEVPDGPGAHYPITILSGVTPEMRAYHEELFGPVAVLYRVSSADEAVDVANDTRFGLGSTVFTADVELADRIADRLEAGMVGLNILVRSQPGMPFGGVKASGIGRELGRLGLDEFANKKVLRIATPDSV